MKKALVIDDGPDSLLVCRTILEAAGYGVVEAIDDHRAWNPYAGKGRS